jgi:hypothetical protein
MANEKTQTQRFRERLTAVETDVSELTKRADQHERTLTQHAYLISRIASGTTSRRKKRVKRQKR